MKGYQQQLLFYYTFTVVFFTILQELLDIPVTFFANKHNIFNLFFIKLGWLWVGGGLLLFMPFAAKVVRNSIPYSFIRWTGATLYWFLLTQWFFGDSLLERIFHHSGACSNADAIHPRFCKQMGGTWNGFDISGHCFLIIHSSLVIWEELRVLHAVKKPTQSLGISIMSVYLVFILFLWWTMLVATCLYYHSIFEKLMGAFFGFGYWILVYGKIIPQYYPSFSPTWILRAKDYEYKDVGGS